MYRLVLDVTISEDQEESIKKAKELIEFLNVVNQGRLSGMKYRLSRDEDRSIRNYLDIDTGGHASTKKLSL